MQRFNHFPKSVSPILNILLLVGIVGTLGCSGGSQSTGEAAASKGNIQALGALYGQCMDSLRGRPPKDEAQFRSFLESKKAAQSLEQFGITNIDDLWTASRYDGKIVVTYGNQVGQGARGGLPYIAYESETTGGKRYIVDPTGASYEVKDAQFRQYFPNAP